MRPEALAIGASSARRRRMVLAFPGVGTLELVCWSWCAGVGEVGVEYVRCPRRSFLTTRLKPTPQSQPRPQKSPKVVWEILRESCAAPGNHVLGPAATVEIVGLCGRDWCGGVGG